MTVRIKNELPRKTPHHYSKEELEWLGKNFNSYKMKDLVVKFNEAFGLNLTEWQLYSVNRRKGNWKEKVYTKEKVSMFTEEMEQYIKDNIKGHTYKELSKMFKDKFDVDRSPEQICSYCSGQLHIGNERYRKHSKRIWYNPDGTVREHDSYDIAPVGTVKLAENRGNTAYIKVNNNKDGWIPYGKYVWEKAHGKLKDYEHIFHLDKNPLNNSLDNLIIVTDGDNANICALKGGYLDSPEMNKAIIGLTKLERRINGFGKENKIFRK